MDNLTNEQSVTLAHDRILCHNQADSLKSSRSVRLDHFDKEHLMLLTLVGNKIDDQRRTKSESKLLETMPLIDFPLCDKRHLKPHDDS